MRFVYLLSAIAASSAVAMPGPAPAEEGVAAPEACIPASCVTYGVRAGSNGQGIYYCSDQRLTSIDSVALAIARIGV